MPLIVSNLYQAKTNFSKLVASAMGGDDIIIAKAGKPVATLRRYESVKKVRKPGRLKGSIKIADDFNEESKEINAMFYQSP